jgi:hypothetical protein
MVATICLVAFFCVMGWVGDYDYCEQVILHMSQEEYDTVKNLLTDSSGNTPSDREIAHWWAEHNTE